jgi:mRNA interferase MazF
MIRSEIWRINLNPTIGGEIQKIRPCIIVSDDAIGILPLKVIVPLTDWKERYNSADWMIKIVPDSENNLSKDSAIDCFQVRSLSTNRFVEKIGNITDNYMEQIEKALKVVLKIR